MDMQTVTQYLTQYGAVAVFVVVFLEYLNLPGFPAGVIMPAAGIFASRGGLNFGLILFLSVLAGLCGSWALYAVGRLGGTALLQWFARRYPRQAPVVEQTVERIRQKGYAGVFLAKLIPAVRTLISIPAGALRMNFAGYTVFSLLGITLWNLAFIGAGFLFGEAVFHAFG